MGRQQDDEYSERACAQPREGDTNEDHRKLVLRRVAADTHGEHVGR